MCDRDSYTQVSVPPSRTPGPRLQIIAGMNFIHKLGDTRKEPAPVTSGIKAANSAVRD